MAITQKDLDRSPDFWWLRFRYATRDGRKDEAAEARRRLKELGVVVRPCKPASEPKGESA